MSFCRGLSPVKFWMRDGSRRADPGRGRFRAFLIKSLSGRVADQFRHERRAGRSPAKRPVSLDTVADPVDESTDPRLLFDIEWARQVLGDALEQMKVQCIDSGRQDLWVVFDARVVGPTLGQTPAVPYAELVARHGLGSPEQASNLLMTAKRLFRRCLRAVVRGYAPTRPRWMTSLPIWSGSCRGELSD